MAMVPPEPRVSAGPFLFAVDHCFAIKGQGTVMTGTVLQVRAGGKRRAGAAGPMCTPTAVEWGGHRAHACMQAVTHHACTALQMLHAALACCMSRCFVVWAC